MCPLRGLAKTGSGFFVFDETLFTFANALGTYLLIYLCTFYRMFFHMG